MFTFIGFISSVTSNVEVVKAFPQSVTVTGSLSTLNLYKFMKVGRPSEACPVFITLTGFLSSVNT